MSHEVRLLVVALDEARLAFPVEQVERVVSAAFVTEVPRAPSGVVGVLDVAGRIVPVVDARARLGLAPRSDGAFGVSSQFVILAGAQGPVALIVDEAQGLQACLASTIHACEGEGLNGAQADGIVRLRDGLVLVTDVSRFLFPQEYRALIDALADT